MELGYRVSGIIKIPLVDKEVNGGVSGAPLEFHQGKERTDEW